MPAITPSQTNAMRAQNHPVIKRGNTVSLFEQWYRYLVSRRRCLKELVNVVGDLYIGFVEVKGAVIGG